MIENTRSFAGNEPFTGLGEALLALGGRLTRLQTELLAGLPQPLTIRQYRILARVRGGSTSLTELCKLAHRNPSTMSESVDKLVAQGLLSKGVSSTSRRTMRLAMTRTGTSVLAAADRALDAFCAELTCGVPADRQGILLAELNRVYREVQGSLDEG